MCWSVRGNVSTSSTNFDAPRVYDATPLTGCTATTTPGATFRPLGSACVESRECELESYCSDEGIRAPQIGTGFLACEFSEKMSPQGSCVNDVCVDGDSLSTLFCGGEL